jgi:RNA polymerase sigma factor for flagellar operon FliA
MDDELGHELPAGRRAEEPVMREKRRRRSKVVMFSHPHTTAARQARERAVEGPIARAAGKQWSSDVEQRIDEALRLVPMIVTQMKEHLNMQARRDDLTSFANEGALRAGRTFDPERGVPFVRWATLKIRGAIVDGLRVDGSFSRRFYMEIRAFEARTVTREERAHEGGELPRSSDAGAADVRLGGTLAAIATAYAMGCFMASDDATLESLQDHRDSPEEELAHEELKAAVRAAIRERPADERHLLERYYFDGATMADAAGGLSRSWASRLHARALCGVMRSLGKAKSLL